MCGPDGARLLRATYVRQAYGLGAKVFDDEPFMLDVHTQPHRHCELPQPFAVGIHIHHEEGHVVAIPTRPIDGFGQLNRPIEREHSAPLSPALNSRA